MMENQARPALKALYLAIICGGLAQATQAQERQSDQRLRTIEEVIVTAQKVEESLQDTPVSVTAFSAQELQQIGVSEVGDIAHFTPNLEMRKQTASEDSFAVAIRGIFTGDAALTVDSAVGLYQDGVYIARIAGAAFDIVDLERIEVMRGPQGTLFGRNTIGGAINIITEKPRGEWAAKVKAGFGKRDRQLYQATIDTPKVGDFAAKLSFLKMSKDGPVKSFYTGDTLGDSTSEAFRLALRWTPNEDTTIDYVYDDSDSDNNNALRQVAMVRPFQVAAGGPFFQNVAQMASTNRLSKLPIPASDTDSEAASSDIEGHALTVEWRANQHLTFKSISSYRELDSINSANNFGSFPSDGANLLDLTGRFSGTGNIGMVPAGTLVPIFFASNVTSHEQLTQEFQFTGNLFNDRLSYIAGLYYFEEQGDVSNPQQFVVPDFGGNVLGFGSAFVLGAPFLEYSMDNKSYAAYGQFTYSVLQNLDLTLGLRYTIDEKETTLTNTLDGTLKTLKDDEDWSNFNPSFTVSYRWSDQVNTYAKVATGYRAGGYNIRSRSEAAFRDPADEENVISYEIGAKTDLLDRTLRFNAALFYTDYEDRQISQFIAGTGGASTKIANAGKSTTSGVELEAVWLPITGLKLSASYGYLDLEFDEFATVPVNAQTGLTVGTTNVDIADTAAEDLWTPEQSGSLAAEYSFSPWEFGQLTVRLDATYTDSMGFDPQLDLIKSNSYALVNARATLADIPAGKNGNLQISAWVKNLENKDYLQFVTDFGQLGSVTTKWGEPRMWGVDFTYHFNR